MPKLSDYVKLAPFGISDLVDAANSVTRNRPRLEVSIRTARYYISLQLLASPQGSPKLARYGMDHLIRLVGYRCLLDGGTSLEQAKIELDRLMLDPSVAMDTVQEMVDRVEVAQVFQSQSFSQSQVRESRQHRSQVQPMLIDIRQFSRLPLTPEITLELPSNRPLSSVLREAQHAIEEILDEIDNTT